MKKYLIGILLTLLLIIPIYSVGIELLETNLKIYKLKFFEKLFTEPFEKVIFYFTDDTAYLFTSNEAYSVGGSISQIVEFFEKEGKKMENLLIVIHNHLVPSGFSETDRKTYRYLKNKGFRGIFCIYFPVSGKVKVMED